MHRLSFLIAGACVLVLTACAQPASHLSANSPDDAELYLALGGMSGIDTIVEETTFRILNDSRIAHYFATTDLDRFKAKLAEQICVEAGGPCQYTGDSMPLVHKGMAINKADFNALVEDLQAAMNFLHVPRGAQNKLLARLAPMRGDIIYK